ncbi:MAG: serine/threonine-protein kinase [Gemmatales bacterium]
MEIQSIFSRALDISDAQARAAFLDAACADNPELRARVEALLAARFRDEQFLEDGPVQMSTVSEGTAAYDPPSPVPTLIAGKYKIREKLGEGGMGAVYVVETVKDVKAYFALKLIKPGYNSRHVLARFEQERQALALMNHPNIAKFIDAGATETGQPFFVMELIKGMPITKYCDQEKLTVEERLNLFRPLCEAVQHAHQKGVIHRDLKPGNILVANFDGKPVPKIIDFGVAKATLLPLTDKSIYSEIGSMIGTLEYMSPEQAEINSLDIDTRADLYSLGVILYELLTGTTPFTRKELSAAAMLGMLKMIREEEPPKPSTKLSGSGSLPSVAAQRKINPAALTRKLHGELDWIVMKCLEKERNRRYEGPTQLAHDIENYLADLPLIAGPPTAMYRFKKFYKRHKGKVLAAAVLLLTLVGGIIGTTYGMVKAVKAREEAVDSAETSEETVSFLTRDLLGQAGPFDQAVSFHTFDKNMTLKSALDRAAEKLNTRLDNRPKVKANLYLTIGKSYLQLTDYQHARPHLEAAEPLLIKHYGETHPLTLECKYRRARLMHFLVDDAQAVSIMENAMAQVKAARLANTREGLHIQHELALAYQDTEKAELLERAEGIFRQLILDDTKYLGSDDGDTILAKRDLAGVCVLRKKYEEAFLLFGQALDWQTRHLGRESPVTQTTMNNFARAYRNAGQFDKAIAMYMDLIEISQRTLGDDHTDHIININNLGRAYLSKGDLERAIRYLEQARTLNQKRGDPDAATTLANSRNLGEAYLKAKRPAEAKASLLIALNMASKKFGNQNERTRDIARDLVTAHSQLQESEQAQALKQRFKLEDKP